MLESGNLRTRYFFISIFQLECMAADKLSIRQVELYKLLIPLKEPFVISLGPQYNAESIMVVIRTDEGITGFGECSPYTSINGESLDTCFVVGRDFANIF